MAQGLEKLAELLGTKQTVAKAKQPVAKNEMFFDDEEEDEDVMAKGDDMFADDEELENEFADEMMAKGDDYDDDYEDDDEDEDDEEIFAKASNKQGHVVDGTEVLGNILSALEDLQRTQRVMAKAVMDVGNMNRETRRQMQVMSKAMNDTQEVVGNAPRVAKSGRRRPKSKSAQPKADKQMLAKAVNAASSNRELFTANDVAVFNSMANRGDMQAIQNRFTPEQLNAVGLLKN